MQEIIVEDDADIEAMFELAESTTPGNLPNLKWLHENFKSKSARIRYMHTLDHDTKTISSYLDIRYQHVYNVIEQYKKDLASDIADKCCPVCKNRK